MPEFFCSTIRILSRHFSVGKKRTWEKFTLWGETIGNGFVYFSLKPSNLKTSVKLFHSPSLRVSSLGSSCGGAGKGRTVFNYVSGICIEKVEAKCWLAKLTLVMTLLPLARRFQCLFTLAVVSASRWLAKIWQLIRREATRELEMEFKFQAKKRSCKVFFPFPARPPEHPGELACRLLFPFLLAFVIDGTKLLVKSMCASQRRNPCSGTLSVYQDLSTHRDWPVKKAIVQFEGKFETHFL